MALSADTLAVGSQGEASNATGVDGNQGDATMLGAGAVYVFTRSGSTWSQQAYLKASNTRPGAFFGFSLALSGDTLAVGATRESSNATGVNGNQLDASMDYAGAVYVFTRSDTTWLQQGYLKASNTQAYASFGSRLALSENTLAVVALGESSNAKGVNGNQLDTSMRFAGAAYVFTRAGTTWSQKSYIKATNTRARSNFGSGVALSEDTLAIGAAGDSSKATGVNGDQSDSPTANAGACYVFR